MHKNATQLPLLNLIPINWKSFIFKHVPMQNYMETECESVQSEFDAYPDNRNERTPDQRPHIALAHCFWNTTRLCCALIDKYSIFTTFEPSKRWRAARVAPSCARSFNFWPVIQFSTQTLLIILRRFRNSSLISWNSRIWKHPLIKWYVVVIPCWCALFSRYSSPGNKCAKSTGWISIRERRYDWVQRGSLAKIHQLLGQRCERR